MDLLKFVVLDEEDLEVVSTHVQDAVVKAAEVMWRPREKRLVMPLNRFDWESAQASAPEYRRRRAALRFERVLSCKCRQIDGKDAVLNLLAVEFAETDAPSASSPSLFPAGRPCGWRSNAWRRSLPISAPPGPPPPAPPIPSKPGRPPSPKPEYPFNKDSGSELGARLRRR